MSDDPKSPGALFDIHTHAEFVLRDVDATMATMSDRPHITNVPTMTGGLGHEAVRQFYDSWFVGHLPDDWTVELLSRTESKDQVVDEVIASFTHDCPMECFLPGVPPTGRKVTIPLVVVVGCKDGKVTHEHIYWDQASMLVQIGLLNKNTLPVTGAEQAARLLDPSLPSNTLIPKD
jgi:carboxymethylenebutenolidase